MITQLSKNLFWDVDFAKLEWEKHQLLIVERVIARGSYQEFKLTELHYGKNKMAHIAKRIAYLPTKDMNFVSIYFNLPLNELKCYTKKQSGHNFIN